MRSVGVTAALTAERWAGADACGAGSGLANSDGNSHPAAAAAATAVTSAARRRPRCWSGCRCVFTVIFKAPARRFVPGLLVSGEQTPLRALYGNGALWG
ncbi:hypothetical protein MCNF_51380 [Mycolicibacterium confluentis]|uniref:Uncharacterized protein n=1 Tax=Mycolicibacterium confluentis TaxID=28047 RepID=A0A7I7Y617_9MYCO|nr:hypothetical protein MCNF_51380 [Mycolicibacterium confluentis]